MEKFQFTPEQIENLRIWKNSLTSERARNWAIEEDDAEIKTSNILNDKKFKQGENLSPEKLDELFSYMRKFSNNRALSNLLYRKNGIDIFNEKLRNLIHGPSKFAYRVDDFFKLTGVGMQTLSQFLIATNIREYPLISSQCKDVIGIDSEQEQAALSEAFQSYKIENPDDLLERTKDYLRDVIIYKAIKDLLDLEKYSEVNNLLWFGTEQEEEGPEEAFKSFGSISIENDLRDFLAENPSFIERGLTLIGKEYDTRLVGKIDLLFNDNKGTHLVIELKKGRKSDEVVGQILRYIGWVQEKLNPKVKGIIIVNEPDDRLLYAVGPIKNLIDVRFYKVKFEISKRFP